jgi:hypothetical protein
MRRAEGEEALQATIGECGNGNESGMQIGYGGDRCNWIYLHITCPNVNESKHSEGLFCAATHIPSRLGVLNPYSFILWCG